MNSRLNASAMLHRIGADQFDYPFVNRDLRGKIVPHLPGLFHTIHRIDYHPSSESQMIPCLVSYSDVSRKPGFKGTGDSRCKHRSFECVDAQPYSSSAHSDEASYRRLS